MKYIESTQNKQIKERAKLLQKKERDRSGLFLVEGHHMIEEAMSANCLKEIYLLEGEDNFTDLEPIFCSQQVINKLSLQNSNAKIIGVCTKPDIQPEKFDVVLLLDGIQDPGNVGTILRSAYAFGVDYVYLSKDCADIYNPKTLQSSQGAIFHIGTMNTDLYDTIRFLQIENTTIYATSLHEPYKNLQDVKPKLPYGLVLGNEGKGIRQDILNICDMSIKIEMDTFESLNVATACSICLYTLKHAS